MSFFWKSQKSTNNVEMQPSPQNIFKNLVTFDGTMIRDFFQEPSLFPGQGILILYATMACVKQ